MNHFMIKKTLLKMKFSIISLLLLAGNMVFGQAIISQRLEKIINESPESYQNVSLLLSDRFEIVSLDNQLNAQRADQKTRVYQVITNLQEKADHTQADIIQFLKNSESVRPESIKPLWITNIIFCTVKSSYIRTIATHPGISVIDLDAELMMVESKSEVAPPMPFAPNGAEPGLKAIKADKLWALGYTGYGRKAYVADTGIDPVHPAYEHKTRALFVPQDQAWFDIGGSTTPTNCGDHGSHCLGTILGLDRLNNDTIGVAFNAQWMGGKILCGGGTYGILQALQWAINPDGNKNTTDDMPDVINNSWYDPGVANDCESGYVDVEAALEAAGIASIFSAGNAGPDEATITPPHNVNISVVNSFTVGAVNGNSSSFPIADFSSRGPSKCGGTGSILIKPEVSAPGVSVRSCTFDKAYDLKSGTSMAAPHTCGAILLLKEAFPYLSGYDFKMALYNTCTDLGVPGEDNVYGQGIINVWAAYNYLIAQGNTPVDPHRKNDLILIDVDVERFQCEQKLRSFAHIENAGTDTVFSFVFQFTITNKQGVPLNFTQTWNGIMLPRERIFFQLDEVNAEKGQSVVDYEIVKVNNVNDDGPLNNRVRKEIFIISNLKQTVQLAGGQNVSACSGTQVEVVSGFIKPGRVDWYDALFGGKLIGSGNPFLAPPAANDQTLYMQAVYADFTGRTDIDEQIKENENKPYGGLRMTVHYPFILKSVKVYAATKGVRKIEMYQGNTLLFAKSITITKTGDTRLTLNFPVPAGKDIRLILAEDAKPLAYSLGQSKFPYVIDNVVSIEGNIVKAQNAYCYFYDWQVEYNDFCGRIPVEIPFVHSTLQAGFVVQDTNYIQKGIGANVLFTDTSINAQNRSWSFSNGQTSTELNPVINFDVPGEYIAKLTVSNTDTCFDTEIKKIHILPDTTTATTHFDLNNTFILYPNPNTGHFVIEIKNGSLISMGTELKIFSATGREMFNQKINSSEKEWFVKADKLAPGVYWAKITDTENTLVTKLIIE